MKKIYFYTVLFYFVFLLTAKAQNIWEPTAGPSSGTIHSLQINNLDYLFAVDPTWFFRSEDGNTWINTFSSPSNEFWCLAVNDQYVFVGDFDNGLFRSEDYGDSFNPVGGINAPIFSVAVNPSNGYVFVSAGNGFHRSVDNGLTWTHLSNNNFSLLKINPNGIIFGYDENFELLYHSGDDGVNWLDITGDLKADPFAQFIVYDLAFRPGGLVYARAWNGENHNGVFRSGDNGLSWTHRGLSNSNFFVFQDNSISVNSLGHIFVGVRGGIYRSGNRGNSWKQINGGLNIGSSVRVKNLVINSGGRLFAGIFGGSSPGVYRTIYSTTSQTFLDSLKNLGKTISDVSPAVSTVRFDPPANIPKSNFSPLVESVEISIDEVLHTRTGDLTFTLEHNGVTVTLISEAGGSGQNFISTLLSDDSEDPVGNGTGPFTGFYKPEQPLSAFNGMDPYGDWTLTIGDGYAGNDGILNGWSIQIMLDSPILSADDNSDAIPNDFALYQNYPNPFNPTTNIQYAVSSRQFVTLKIYDLLGREVATLVNEEKPAGTYEVTFSAKGGSASGGNAFQLSSGIYFYQLKATPVGGQVGNEFVQTKKFVLLK